MNDRELLERAAQNAGMSHLTRYTEKITDYDSKHYGCPALHPHDELIGDRQYQSWNSLMDTADAMMLACYFGADIFINQQTVVVKMGIVKVTEKVHGNDKQRALRIAVTKAAAL